LSRADLHVHTTFSDGVATPEDVLNYYALHTGCTVLAITDHDTIDGALHAIRHAETHPDLYGHLNIVIGEEVSTTDGHVIGLYINKWIPPGMDAGGPSMRSTRKAGSRSPPIRTRAGCAGRGSSASEI
jgi:predicted metal-dependent phosphoesterase TrpH